MNRRFVLQGTIAGLVVSAVATARPPPVILVLVCNPRDLVVEKGTVLGLLVVDLFGNANIAAANGVADGIRDRLPTYGIEASVQVLPDFDVPASTWAYWEGNSKHGRWIGAPVAAGAYAVIAITVTNYNEVAREKVGGLAVGFGKAVGVNVCDKVHEEVAEQVHQQLTASGVDALITMI